jgi:anti-sigma B factor antagonist
MTIHNNLRGNVTIIAPSGRLTVETEAEVAAVVRRAFAAGTPHLVLDLAEVAYIDSCGLGLIAQTYVSAFRRGGTVKLANVNGRNRRLLTITKLLPVFEVFNDVDEAVRSFGSDLGGVEPAEEFHRDELDRKASTIVRNSDVLSSLG